MIASVHHGTANHARGFISLLSGREKSAHLPKCGTPNL